MSQRKYSYLCEVVSQLQDQLEPEFLREIGKLETDVESLRIDIHRSRHENLKLSKALTSIVSEVSILLNKIYEIEDAPSFKSTLALLQSWPEDAKSVVIRRVERVVQQSILLSDKASVRSSMMNLVKFGCAPVRAETKRLSKISDVSNKNEDHSQRQRQFQR